MNRRRKPKWLEREPPYKLSLVALFHCLCLCLYLSIAVLFHWYRCAICSVCILALFISFFSLSLSFGRSKRLFELFFRMNLHKWTCNEQSFHESEAKKKKQPSKKNCYFFKGNFFRATKKTYIQKPHSRSFVANKRKYTSWWQFTNSTMSTVRWTWTQTHTNVSVCMRMANNFACVARLSGLILKKTQI